MTSNAAFALPRLSLALACALCAACGTEKASSRHAAPAIEGGAATPTSQNPSAPAVTGADPAPSSSVNEPEPAPTGSSLGAAGAPSDSGAPNDAGVAEHDPSETPRDDEFTTSCEEQECTGDERCLTGPDGTYCVHPCPGQPCPEGEASVAYCTRTGGVICSP